MHPEYRRTQRRIGVTGTLAIGAGVLGLVFPFIPGLVLMFLGFSILSLRSGAIRDRVAVLRSKYPEISKRAQVYESRIFDFFNLTTHTHEYYDVPGQAGPLSVLVEVSPENVGAAIILHSASGTKEMPILNVFSEGMRAHGFTTVRFDAFHGMGESGGDFERFTGTSFYDDLGTIVAWAKQQEWWRGTLYLVGHSIGGLAAMRYAGEHPDEVGALILYGPMVSGDRFLDAFRAIDPEGLRAWQAEGVRTVRHPLTDESHHFSYAFVEDACGYDFVRDAHTLQGVVTHILAGERDRTTPVSDCTALRDALGAGAHLHVLPKLTHNPRHRSDLQVLYKTLLSLPLPHPRTTTTTQ